jgi:hypothetical protein
MSSVKRRKIGGDIPASIQAKASPDLESTASSSPAPELSNDAVDKEAPEESESPKTFKDLVCNFEN